MKREKFGERQKLVEHMEKYQNKDIHMHKVAAVAVHLLSRLLSWEII